MSVINVSVSGGTGSTTTATTGDTVDVIVGNLSVGTLPALQIAAGTGITIATSNGVSTISSNLAELSIPANLADLADVQPGSTSGQVLSYNGTAWSGLTLSVPANLADLANVEGTPTAGQVLSWNGSAWSPADDQTGGASDVANLADLQDVSATSPSSGQALTWDGSQWAAANVPVGTTVNGLSGTVTLVAGDNINVSADGQNITIGTIGQASISNLTDLVDVNTTMSPASGQALVWDGSEWTADSVTALVSNGTTLDLGTGKILYSNVYDTLADLPAAGDYHGMFAHVHNHDGLGTGAAVYAHAGNWVRLADSDDVPTSYVSAVNGLSGAVSIGAGSGVTVSQAGSTLLISAQGAATSVNSESGAIALVGGDGIGVETSDGVITVSSDPSGVLVGGRNIEISTSGQNTTISTIADYAETAQLPNVRDLTLVQTEDGKQHFMWSANDGYSRGYTLEVVEVGVQQNISNASLVQVQANGSIDFSISMDTENIGYVSVFAAQNHTTSVWEEVDFLGFTVSDNQVVMQGGYLPENFTAPGTYPIYAAVADVGAILIGTTDAQNITVGQHGEPEPPEIISVETDGENITVVVLTSQTPHALGFYDSSNLTYYAEITLDETGQTGWIRGPGVAAPREVETLSVTAPSAGSWFARVVAENPLGEGPPGPSTP